jgi:hypothetical protein
MAQTVVQVAQGQLHDDMRRVVLGIFHLAAHGRHGWDDDGYYSDDCLDDPSRQAAINAATAWCNNTLMPQTEARLKALSEVCVQTQQRIQQAFATLVEDLKSVNDPFVAMTTATAPAANTPTHGGGGGRPAGGGAPGGGSFTPPPSPTFPTSATGSTTPQGTGSSPTPGVPMVGSDPTGSDPTVGITRPAGLPAGAGWIPPGVPLPPGWSEDPSTGAVLPKGPIDPKHDIHKNRDGSVSLGADRGLTISPEKGRRGVFSLTDTDPDGTVHTYHVRFDQHGHPVVTEVVPKDGTAGLDDSAAPGSGVSGGVAAGTAAAAHAGPAGSPDLAQGAQVGSDDAMGAASIPTQASPVAGSAAAAGQQSGAHQGGAIGGMPMGAGMGRGAGGQEQEAARKYQQRGDVVGEDDLEEWQRMGPVIGEK